MQFQLTVGSIPRMMGKGHAAEAVQKMCLKMGEEMGDLPPPGPIKRMILFDRFSAIHTLLARYKEFKMPLSFQLSMHNHSVPFLDA